MIMNWGRSLRFRQQNLCETPPSGESIMTSNPFGNKTSLSRKSCIPDKSYYGTLIGSHGRSFRIRHENSPEAPLGGEITMTSYPVGNKTSLTRKPCIPDKKLYGSLSWSLGRLVIFILKKQILIKKTYQFINVANGVSCSHKTANVYFFIWLSSIAC